MGGSRILSLGAAAAAFALLGGTAAAAPAVSLRLSGALVERDARGVEHAVPLGAQRVQPGETIRYTLLAVNRGDEAARRPSPVARIPAGTAYAGASAPGAPVRLEFSLDGTTFSARPMVSVRGPSGLEQRPADPAQYVALRWSGLAQLAPRAARAFEYTVRVR